MAHAPRLPGSRLNGRQKKFCDAYAMQPLGKKNLMECLRRAGYRPHPSTASRLMRDPAVREEILRLDPGLGEELPSTAGIDAHWVLFELAGLWEADIADLFGPDGRLLPIDEIPYEVRKLIASFEVETGPDGQVTTSKVRLVDRLGILRDIARHRDVMAYEQERLGIETDRSLARLLDAAADAVERSAPERATDVSSRRMDGQE